MIQCPLFINIPPPKTLGQWFSKCGPQPIASPSLRNTNTGSLAKSSESELLGLGPSTLCFSKPLGDSDIVWIREKLLWGKTMHDPSLMNKVRASAVDDFSRGHRFPWPTYENIRQDVLGSFKRCPLNLGGRNTLKKSHMAMESRGLCTVTTVFQAMEERKCLQGTWWWNSGATTEFG